MNKMIETGFNELTQSELIAIYRILNGKIVDFSSINWSYNLLQEILDEISEKKETEIDTSVLFKKLFLMSDKELLNLIIKSESFWGVENDATKFNLITPEEQLLIVSTIGEQQKSYLKFDLNMISELEFLMVSQTLQNNFIVEIFNSGEEYFAEKFSVNNYTFHKLLPKLSSDDTFFKVKKLQEAKANIF